MEFSIPISIHYFRTLNVAGPAEFFFNVKDIFTDHIVLINAALYHEI